MHTGETTWDTPADVPEERAGRLVLVEEPFEVVELRPRQLQPPWIRQELPLAMDLDVHALPSLPPPREALAQSIALRPSPRRCVMESGLQMTE